MTLRSEARGGWQVAFATVGVGCDDGIAPFERTGGRSAASTRDEFAARAGGVGLAEWYEPRPCGIEHGFTLERSPCAVGTEIQLQERIAGLVASPRADGRGLDLRDERGVVRAHYTDLRAVDARGRSLPSWMEARADGVALHVDAAGAVFPVDVDPLAWFQTQKLVASGGAAAALFGAAVRMSGDTAVVGAPEADGNAGAAYVFVQSGGVWSEQQALLPGDPASLFGAAVAVEGDTALVGAPGLPGSAGAAYVFTRSGGTWAQTQKLVSPGTVPNFGVAVAMAGTTALVAANAFSPLPGQGAGIVYVYAQSGAPWTLQQQLQSNDGTGLDQFGLSLDLSGSTAVISAQAASIGSNVAQGAVYVFVQSGSGFTQHERLLASDGASNDLFGQSVALDGSTLLVGAPQATVGSNRTQGAVYVFGATGGTFVQDQKLVAVSGAVADQFGRSVALAGGTAVIGSTRASNAPGQAYVFSLGAGSWTQTQQLTASDGIAGDEFSEFVATDGALALVGAPGATVGSNVHQGAVYVEELLSQLGDACTADGACGSGHCVDGVCCDAACDLQCQACDVASHVGTCSTVSGSPHKSHAPCASSGPGCGGTCDGTHADTCEYPPPGKRCATSCTGNKETDSACDGKGACVVGSPAACRDNLRCDATTGACYPTCSANDQCAGGYVCAAGKCVPGAGCIDGHTSQGPAGAQDCSPYACDTVTGLCNARCTTVDECSAPSVCDFSGACVAPPDTAALPAGCSIAAARGGTRAPVLPALASLAIAWALRSRTWRRARGRARAGSNS